MIPTLPWAAGLSLLSATPTTLGWLSALLAVGFHGSFAVPIKSPTCQRLDIDPLVFQSYKTLLCLLFSLVVTRLLGLPLRVSPWGLVSGLFWVPSGVATVYAVKFLGLAVAVAVGNSLLALVSFTWGIFIFEERVRSVAGASGAVLLMIVGFVGMSYYSTVDKSNNTKNGNKGELEKEVSLPLLKEKQDDVTDGSSSDSDEDLDPSATAAKLKAMDSQRTIRKRNGAPVSQGSYSIGMDLEVGDGTTVRSDQHPTSPDDTNTVSFKFFSRDVKVSKFTAGLLVATCGGIWGGSLLIPMKLCHQNTSGPGYLMSFSVGASVVTTGCWMLRWWYHSFWTATIVPNSSSNDTKQIESVPSESATGVSKTTMSTKLKLGYQALPSFHVREMWLPGGLSGLVWSTGNFFAILSVHYLGAGVGYCVVQASMLVGGMWGIFYFQEIRGPATIAKWFASALVTISGILWLAYEHIGTDEASAEEIS